MDVTKTPLGDLKPSAMAARTVNLLSGGLRGVYSQIGDLNVDVMCSIIAAGLGKRPKEVEDQCFEVGYTNLVEPCLDFLNLLASGGKRDLPATEDKDKGDR